MTTNTQNLTFGEWLNASSISPDTWQSLDPAEQTDLHDAWEEGWPPVTMARNGK